MNIQNSLPNETNTSPILSLQNVAAYYWRRKHYLKRQRYWALKDISFNLYHGESLGIIGKNGAGKSTLLKLLAGIIKPNKGILINKGYNATLLTLQIGFVPNLSGRENAILSGMMLGMHKTEIKAKLETIKEFSQLDDFFDQPIETYSSGMRTRLGFSVAFHLDPDVLLVDEVLGVGDTEFRRKSTAVMHEKIRSNKTIVLVSHNAATIRDLCNRVVWIENGKTHAEGETGPILEEYEKLSRTNGDHP